MENVLSWKKVFNHSIDLFVEFHIFFLKDFSIGFNLYFIKRVVKDTRLSFNLSVKSGETNNMISVLDSLSCRKLRHPNFLYPKSPYWALLWYSDFQNSKINTAASYLHNEKRYNTENKTKRLTKLN